MQSFRLARGFRGENEIHPRTVLINGSHYKPITMALLLACLSRAVVRLHAALALTHRGYKHWVQTPASHIVYATGARRKLRLDDHIVVTP